MKIARPTPGNNDNTEVNEQAGPKLRNINDKGEDIIYDEKPEGADKRLIAAAIAMIVFIVIIVVKGNITNSSLTSQLEEQNKLLSAAQSEALIYGITEDEDGDLVLPSSTSAETSTESQNVSDLEWDSLEERNNTLLNSFADCILTYNGNNQYNAKRQELIDTWGFTEDSKLLSKFMRPLDEDEVLSTSMKFVSPATIFTLSNDGKNMTYFMICTVRSSSTGSSGNTVNADGTVGIRLTINEDGTLSNVTVQTLTRAS